MGRKKLFHDYRLPSAYHGYWIRDMDQARADDASLLLTPPNGEQPRYLFFPGCQLGASDPRYPKAAYELLLQAEPATAMLLTCCGAPVYWAGEINLYRSVQYELKQIWEQLGRPLLVLACLSCRQIFNYVLPEIKTTTLYEVLAAAPQVKLPTYPPGETFALADPCTARGDQALRDAVCSLLERMHVDYQILHQDMETLPCCGFGGNIHGADPDKVRQVAKRRIGLDPRPFIAYCANCRDIYASAGKDTAHLLDLLTGINGKDRPVPHLSLRRDNRRRARRLVLGETQPTQIRGIKLVFDEAQAELMDRSYINTDYVTRVIEHGETTNEKLIDDQGISIAHLRLCDATVWVEYQKLADNEYRLINCYYHRMEPVGLPEIAAACEIPGASVIGGQEHGQKA